MSDLDTDCESAYFFHVQFRILKDKDGKLQRGGIYFDSTGYGLIALIGLCCLKWKEGREKREAEGC